MKITKTEIKIFIMFFLISAFFIHWGGWYENSVFSLTRAIVDERRFEIDSFANQTSDRAYFNGHYYSDKAPLTSIVGIPSYVFSKSILGSEINKDVIKIFDNNKTALYAYKNPGTPFFTTMIVYTICTSVIFSALSVVVFYKILSYFFDKEKHKLILTFVCGFATLVFPYSLSVNVLPTAIFFLLLSFYFLLRQQKNHKLTELLIAGIFLGVSFTADYTIGAAAFFMVFYVFLKTKSFNKTLVFFASFVISLLPLMSYNYLLLHDPFTFMQKYMDPNIFPAVPQEVFNLYGFLVPNVGVMYQVLIGLYRGLFFYYPILILSIVGLFYMLRDDAYKKEALLFLFVFIGYVVFNSARITWHGGYSFGPKYLYYTVPFLTIALGFAFKDFRYTSFKLVFVAFLCLSLFFNILSLQLMEDQIIDFNTLLIQDKYQKITNSFGMLPNSLYGHYMPMFLQYGPKSMIIENLMSGHWDADIRDIPFSRNWIYPYHSNVNMYWIYLLILLIPIGIWFKEIVYLYKRKFHNYE